MPISHLSPENVLKVVKFLKSSDLPSTFDAIVSETNLTEKEVYSILRSMKARTEVVSPSRGLYAYNYAYVPVARGRPLKNKQNQGARPVSLGLCFKCNGSILGTRIVKAKDDDEGGDKTPPAPAPMTDKQRAECRYDEKLHLLNLIASGKSIYSESPLIKSMIEDYKRLIHPSKGHPRVK